MGARLDLELTPALCEARAAQRLRSLEARAAAQGARVNIAGRWLTNFTSNDYLGLAAHPRIVDRVRRELPRHGFGSGAAALLSGRSALHAELEERLARATGMEAGLLFSSGYLANLGTLGALLDRGSSVAHDRLNHASLVDAVRASGAAHRRYRHGDPSAADAAPSASTTRRRWLVTESVFSMDGDIAPLPLLGEAAYRRGAGLYVDDAHGFGVLLGDAMASARIPAEIRCDAIVMVTLGKALGSHGAAVLASRTVIDFLVQRARTFVFDTAPPAVCAAAALEALDMLTDGSAGHDRLRRNVASFRECAARAGVPLLPVDTPIQPIILGDDARALAAAEALSTAGFYVRAIRPPTVPVGTARLRITITAAHAPAEIEGLVAVLAPLVRP